MTADLTNRSQTSKAFLCFTLLLLSRQIFWDNVVERTMCGGEGECVCVSIFIFYTYAFNLHLS